MKKIYVFTTDIMNGTVTMRSDVQACASKELAEQVKCAVEKANCDNLDLRDFGFRCSDIVEIELMEVEDDAPILKHKHQTANQYDIP